MNDHDYSKKKKPNPRTPLTVERFVVRLRGLPWTCTRKDVVKFLSKCHILDREKGVHFSYDRDGRLSGEAYVELRKSDDVQKALARDRQYLLHRYIEVFKSDPLEMEWALTRFGYDRFTGCTLRVRGLPFDCTKEEIVRFFSGLAIVPGGVTLPVDHVGRSTGDAFVQFAAVGIAEKALLRHMGTMRHRYIEVFRTNCWGIREFFEGHLPRLGKQRPPPHHSQIVPPNMAVPVFHGQVDIMRHERNNRGGHVRPRPYPHQRMNNGVNPGWFNQQYGRRPVRRTRNERW